MFIIVYNFGNNKYMIKIKEELLEYKFVWIQFEFRNLIINFLKICIYFSKIMIIFYVKIYGSSNRVIDLKRKK